MPLNPKLYQWLVGCFAAFGSFTFGYDLGVISEILPALQGVKGFSPDATAEGVITSLLSVGAFAGAFISAYISDGIGRRGTILTATLFFCFGAALQCGSQNNAFLMGGRFVTGMGIGMYCMIVPMYQAEIAHPSIRGYLTSLQQLFLGIGGLVSSWIGYGCYIHLSGEARFRIPLGLQIIPAAILGSFIFLFPESPRWLMQKDREDLALQTLARLHANGNTDDPIVLAQIAEIREHLAEARTQTTNPWKQIVNSKAAWRRLIIGMTMQAATQFTGGSTIAYYTPEIFALMGFSNSKALLMSSIGNIIAILGELSCMLFVDKLGRRWPLIGGSLFLSLTFIIGSILIVKYPASKPSNAAHWGFIVNTWAFNYGYAATVGAISWIYPSEIFSNSSRGKAISVTTMTSFAFSTLVSQVTPIALVRIGWKFYLVYVVCNLTNALVFWAFFPETAGVPLEEMDYLFSESDIFVPTAKPLRELAGMNELEEKTRQKQIQLGDSSHVEQFVTNADENQVA